MKIQNISHFTLFVLILGLCSCNSDNKTEKVIIQEDSWSIQSARFVHPDRSSHDIRETRVVRPQSRIEVLFNKESEGPIQFKAESTCYSNQRPYPNYLEIHHLKEEEMTALRLLPPAVFRPKSNNELLQCDFKITARNHRGSTLQYDLKALKISPFNKYFNHNPLSFEDPNNPPYLFLESHSEQEVKVPASSSQTHLLCQQSSISSDSRQGMTLGQLVEPIYHSFQGLQLCRILSTSQDQADKWVSPSFWLQKNQKKVATHFDVHLPADIEVDLYDKPILTLTLENPNDSDVYVNFFEDRSHFKLQPTLYNQRLNMVWYHRLLGSPMRWNFEESKVFLRKDKLVRLKMSAHSRTVIQAYVDIGVRCPNEYIPKERSDENSSAPCPNQTVLWGYTYDFDGLPTLLQSPISHPDSDQWDTLYNMNIPFAEKNYKGVDHMSLWRATQFPHKCTIRVKADEYPRQELATHTSSATGECQQF